MRYPISKWLVTLLCSTLGVALSKGSASEVGFSCPSDITSLSVSAASMDPIERAYSTIRWVEGKKPPLESFRYFCNFLRKNRSEEQLAADLKRMEEAKHVQTVGLFDYFSSNTSNEDFVATPQGENDLELVLNPSPSRAKVVGTMRVSRTVTAWDREMVEDSIVRESGRVLGYREVLEGRLDCVGGEIQRLSRMYGTDYTIPMGNGNWVGLLAYYVPFLSGPLGAPDRGSFIESVIEKVRQLRAAGVQVSKVPVFHTHPLDALLITEFAPEKKPDILWPKISKGDVKFILEMKERFARESVTQGIGVEIIAVTGLDPANLSLQIFTPRD